MRICGGKIETLGTSRNAFWPSAAKSCERGSFLALVYNPELPWHGKDKKVENIERKHM